MFKFIGNVHAGFFGFFQRILQGWFPGLLARLTFAAVLLMYYLNSAKTKVGEGVEGFLQVQDGAFAQILPSVMEKASYDTSAVAFFPYHLIVYAGTYSEFILPVLIVLGMFTRIAAFGMMAFVVVQSYVDIALHHADEATVGAWFDRFPDSAILDQRALWFFLLLYLFIYGAGKISVDGLFGGGSRLD